MRRDESKTLKEPKTACKVVHFSEANYVAIQEELAKIQSKYEAIQSEHSTLQSKYDVQGKEHEILKEQYSTLESKHTGLQILVNKLQRLLFGIKSEKQVRALEASGQLYLSEELEQIVKCQSPDMAEAEVPTTTIKSHERKTSKKQKIEGMNDDGLRFDESKIDVVEEVIKDPRVAGLKEDEYTVIDTENRYILMKRPSAFYVKKEIYEIVKIKATDKIITPAPPDRLLDKSYADKSFIIGMLIDKFGYHLPLYRQHQMLLAAGIKIARGNLAIWANRSIDLLSPIYEALKESVLLSPVLSLDETPIRVKGSNSPPGKMSKNYYWPIYGDGEIVFEYCEGRSEEFLKASLKAYSGTIMSDGFVAYDNFVGGRRGAVKHAVCWAHARRKFCDIAKYYPVEVGKILDIIGRLYGVEEGIRESGLAGEKKRESRVKESLPIVEEYFSYLNELALKERSPKDALSQAINYSLTRVAELKTYIYNPLVPIDNNHTERQIRNIVMGRKNWLFCWSEVGAKNVGIIQSLLCTCKINGIDFYDYLNDVFDRIHTVSNKEVWKLTPKNWKLHFMPTVDKKEKVAA